jgi:type IV pilus assembly protein PilW
MITFARSEGVSLVELLVAMTIACTIVAGVLGLYAQVRGTYRVNERIARLQEQGRFALSVIEPDVELAGYYGFTNVSDTVRLVHGSSPGTTLATAAQLRQFPAHTGGALPPPVPSLPPGAHACGVNFAVDVTSPVQGSNDVFALGRSATCKPYQARSRAGSDTLTLRRVATQPSDPEAGRIQIYASRLTSRTSQLMFADGNAPGVIDAGHRVHDMLVRTYYVARDSVGQDNFPALRVKTLTRSGIAAAFDDDEVMPGIEDLQVQFGIDVREGDRNGSATRYVNPDFADLPRLQVVAVRIWLRVRSDEPEADFDDGKTYRYASVTYTPSGAERRFRRALMSRTVTLRNARSR